LFVDILNSWIDVLVISKRVVPRFRDLTPEEVTDMALSVQKIARVIEREYQGESMTIAMQDGPLAGQTVPHCHFHLIPRRRNDWPNNDDIYRDLERHSKEYIIEDHERKPRTLEEMVSVLMHNIDGYSYEFILG
jgi:bis(5'-adenosyl)-triphosphatase